MADAVVGARFAVGDRVRTRAVDPPHHTRLPRYARGQVGEVVEVQGSWILADDRAQQAQAARVGRAGVRGGRESRSGP